MADLEKILEEDQVVLSERERGALLHWQQNDLPALLFKDQEQMLTLYLMGYTCEDIRSRFFPRATLGQVVHARIAGRWDRAQRDQYANMRQRVLDRRALVDLDAFHVVADLQTAYLAELKKQVQRYFETGDPKALPWTIDSVDKFQKLLAVWKGVTGREERPTKVQANQPPAAGRPPALENLTPGSAAQELSALLGEE